MAVAQIVVAELILLQKKAMKKAKKIPVNLRTDASLRTVAKLKIAAKLRTAASLKIAARPRTVAKPKIAAKLKTAAKENKRTVVIQKSSFSLI